MIFGNLYDMDYRAKLIQELNIPGFSKDDDKDDPEDYTNDADAINGDGETSNNGDGDNGTDGPELGTDDDNTPDLTADTGDGAEDPNAGTDGADDGDGTQANDDGVDPNAGTDGADDGDTPDFTVDTGDDGGDPGADPDAGADGGDTGSDGTDGGDAGDGTDGSGEDLGDGSEGGDNPDDSTLIGDAADQHIKNIELKQNYNALYLTCDDIINKIGEVPKDDANNDSMKRILDQVSNLKEYIGFYVDNVYDTKSYTENQINIKKYIAILSTIKLVLIDISKDYDVDANGVNENAAVIGAIRSLNLL